MGEIYRQAERLGLDIVAEVYNIILLQWIPERKAMIFLKRTLSVKLREEKNGSFFVDNANAMLFRNNAFSYGVLVKEKRDALSENTEKCVEFLRGL